MTINEIFEIGDKARRKHWSNGIYIETKNGEFYKSLGGNYVLDLYDIMADDWEPVPDKKTREQMIQESKDLQSYLASISHPLNVAKQVDIYIKNVLDYLENETTSNP